MPYTIVLAATRREAVDWARQNDVPFRSIRYAQDAGSIGGRFFDRIVELPSHAKRRDRFSVNAAVKRLKRVLPDIPHEVLESFTPTPPAPSPQKFTREQWLLGDVDSQNPFSNAAPDAPELVADEVDQENPLVQPGEDPIADRKDMDLDLSQPEIPPVEMPTIEAEGPGPVEMPVVEAPKVTEAVTSAAPKRKSRRTNEQKAYDEAKEIFDLEKTEANGFALSAAYDALVARHPDDERVVAEKARVTELVTALPPMPAKPESTPGVAQGAPDLDF